MALRSSALGHTDQISGPRSAPALSGRTRSRGRVRSGSAAVRCRPEGERPSIAFVRDPDLQIAHLPDSMLAEGRVIGRDFRKRDEGKPGSTSRWLPSSSVATAALPFAECLGTTAELAPAALELAADRRLGKGSDRFAVELPAEQHDHLDAGRRAAANSSRADTWSWGSLVSVPAGEAGALPPIRREAGLFGSWKGCACDNEGRLALGVAWSICRSSTHRAAASALRLH